MTGLCGIVRRRRAAEARIRRAEIAALESSIEALAVETRAALNAYEKKQRELTAMRRRLRNLKARKDTKEILQ